MGTKSSLWWFPTWEAIFFAAKAGAICWGIPCLWFFGGSSLPSKFKVRNLSRKMYVTLQHDAKNCSHTVGRRNPAWVHMVLSYFLQGLIHLRWCKISSINSTISFFPNDLLWLSALINSPHQLRWWRECQGKSPQPQRLQVRKRTSFHAFL